jgi:hypothetical protein
MTGNAVINSAFLRSLLTALATGILSLLTAHQQGLSWDASLTGAAIVAVTAIVSRGGIEGGYDSKRAAEGNMNAGDVPMASPKVDVTKTAGA